MKDMQSDGRRPERVAEALLRELSALLYRDLKDPRLRGVTLTDVKLTPDLRHARVYFSHLQGSQRGQEAVAGFHSAAGFIRQKIGRGLGLRYTPELQFEYDPSIERAARIDALLRKEQPKN
jgi:ribosome-binding factor A